MNHLTEDQIYNLADTIVSEKQLTETELLQMDHLKECSKCFDQFLVYKEVLQAVTPDFLKMSVLLDRNALSQEEQSGIDR